MAAIGWHRAPAYLIVVVKKVVLQCYCKSIRNNIMSKGFMGSGTYAPNWSRGGQLIELFRVLLRVSNGALWEKWRIMSYLSSSLRCTQAIFHHSYWNIDRNISWKFKKNIGLNVQYQATYVYLVEFEWFVLFLYASFLEALRNMLIRGPVL